MGPEKTARHLLHCDGCSNLIKPGEAYHIDHEGFLLCKVCAEAEEVNTWG